MTLGIEKLNSLMGSEGLGRTIVCYTRPRNLDQLIGTKRLRDHLTLTPANLMVQRSRAENPNPEPSPNQTQDENPPNRGRTDSSLLESYILRNFIKNGN